MMTKVFSGSNSAEAHLIAEALGQEGIAAFVKEQPPALVPGEGATVWIRDDSDGPRAMALVAEMSTAALTAGSSAQPTSQATFEKGLVLGLVLGCVAAWAALNVVTPAGPRSEAWDTNRDGRADIWAAYGAQGRPSGASFDRDLDGKPDVWQEFDEGGHRKVNRYDNDFDGRADYWEKYEGGSPASYAADDDRDGRIDEWDTV